MRKMFAYMRPYFGGILCCFAFLFVQSFCELSLPNYMSNIVNIGIQQGGIEARGCHAAGGHEVARAEAARDEVARAVPEEEADSLDDGHDREGDAHGGSGSRADLPHEVGVGHVVQGRDEHADNGGHGQRDHKAGHGLRRHAFEPCLPVRHGCGVWLAARARRRRQEAAAGHAPPHRLLYIIMCVTIYNNV